MSKIKFLIFASIFFSCSAYAQEDDPCLQNSMHQGEINNCERIIFAKADAELNRVYNLILKAYDDDAEFLSKLKNSQLAWIKLRNANLEMKYPLEDKKLQYGSVYPMCVSGFNTTLTLQRVKYLKRWLEGIDEGELCSGSIMRPFQINEKTNKI